VPEVSALEQDIIEIDPDTKEMLKMLDFGSISGPQLIQPTQIQSFNRRNLSVRTEDRFFSKKKNK
jgi:Ribosomal S17